MAEDLINIENGHKETHGWIIVKKNGHRYSTLSGSVALWEKSKGSEVTELTIK